jgi:NAD(P)-dependent dehydrogenase (short-subunit alcohol dehydrogenase family)
MRAVPPMPSAWSGRGGCVRALRPLNAGVAWPFKDGFTPAIEPEIWDDVIRINLSSVFYCSKFAIPEIAKAGGGAIINTASSMAHVPLGGLDGYAASKGGVAMLTKSMAVNCGPMNIRVNAISPGYVDTPMNALIFGSDEMKRGFEKGHATGAGRGDRRLVVLRQRGSPQPDRCGAELRSRLTALKRPDLLRGWATSPQSGWPKVA